MTDRPIIFSAPMIRALLDGRKTQTRRVLKPQPVQCLSWGAPPPGTYPSAAGWSRYRFAPGDRLWVRERCATWEGRIRDVVYFADETEQDWANLTHDTRNGAPWKLRTSIHMPRWASRLTLTVTDVRVQRLQEISAVDAVAEGARDDLGHCYVPACPTADEWSCNVHGCWGQREQFRETWNSIHGPDAWDANPWVCAISFDVHRCNSTRWRAGRE